MATRDLVLSCISKSKILKWHVQQNEPVKKDKVIATYIFTEKVTDASDFITQRKLKAKFNGKVVELSVKPNEDVTKGQVVARLIQEECEHNTVMKDMCCDCGADLRKDIIAGKSVAPSAASVPVVHNILELKVSVQEAERLAKYDEQQLLRARKLVLVVDLDMTLIHTTVAPIPPNTKDVFSFTLPGHQYEYHTKLRPGAHKFLENISKFYELHIFTMGSRTYAHTIAKCLDPRGKFFAHRIRSRDEFINSFSKFHDLKALFPCGDHMVSIIDDREDVWNFAPNLITVKPYRYFKSSDDINKPQQDCATKSSSADLSSLDDIVIKSADTTAEVDRKQDENKVGSETSKDEKNPADDKNVVAANGEAAVEKESREDQDDYLFYLAEILERVHHAFYSTLDAVKSKGGGAKEEPDITKYCTYSTVNPDVRVIMPELRRQTLKGVNMVFTGVIPTNCPLEKSKAWKTAVSLGARVSSNIVTSDTPKTTHVVAARHGTQKAHKAYKNPDILLVNPAWLWCTSDRWERAEESVYPVPLADTKSPVPSRNSTPQHNSFEKPKSKKISPLVSEEGFELPGGYNPDENKTFLNPLNSFSKNELDAMDKEVEELMSMDEDSDTGSVKSTMSSNSSNKKRRREAEDDSLAVQLKKKLLQSKRKMEEKAIDEDEGANEDDSSSSSSDSSSDSQRLANDSSDSEDELAEMLKNNAE